MQMERFKLESKIAALKAELDKKTHQDNRKFKRLSRKKQRVAIAQDVLASLAAGKLNAARGTYFEKKKSGCDVCALGSMFTACVLRTSENPDDELDGADEILETESIHERLSPYFSTEELDLIEAAFESWGPEDGEEIGKWGCTEATRKFTKGLGAKRALEKIMRNIIANGGDFVLED